jgi:hypothetical protein
VKPKKTPKKPSQLTPALAKVLPAAIKAGVKPNAVARQVRGQSHRDPKGAEGDRKLIMADQPEERHP